MRTNSMQMQHSMSWLARWLDMRLWRARHSAACSLRCWASEGCSANRWQFCSVAAKCKPPGKVPSTFACWSPEPFQDALLRARCAAQRSGMQRKALNALVALHYMSPDYKHTHCHPMACRCLSLRHPVHQKLQQCSIDCIELGQVPCSRCHAGVHRRRPCCRCPLCSTARTDLPPAALEDCSRANCDEWVQKPKHGYLTCT